MVNQQLFPPLSSKQYVSWHFACKALHCYCNLKSLWQYLPGREFLVNKKSLYFRGPGVCLCLFVCVAREYKSHTITLFEEIRPKLLYGIGLCGIPKRLPPSASHEPSWEQTLLKAHFLSLLDMKYFWKAVLHRCPVMYKMLLAKVLFKLNIIKVFI